MLPLHRLAAQQQQPSRGPVAKTAFYLRALWSSRLATRVLILFGSFIFLATFFSPSSYFDLRRPKFPWFDDDWGPGNDGSLPPPPPHRPGGNGPSPPPLDEKTVALWASRADLVKQSFLHAWDGYDKYAFGFDELLPLSNDSATNLNGWGVTVVDSLSTMKLMGLTDAYDRAMVHVKKMKFRHHAATIPFFETVIRYLGGLLSAYALTKDPLLLQLADELGDTLLPVFETRSGLPMFGNNPSTGTLSQGWTGASLFAEIASCQMEYKYLAHITGKEKYFKKVDNVIAILEKEQWTAKGRKGSNPGNGANEGLFAVRWDPRTGKGLGETATVGAWADSGYEYLLKGYLLSGRSEKRLLNMYLKSVRGVLNNLMYLSGTRNLLYVTDIQGQYSQPGHKLEHLSCFYGGLLALGVETLTGTGDLPLSDAELHRWAAEGLTTTCYLAYAETPSGVGPEEIRFLNNNQHHNRPWMPEVRKWIKGGRKGGVPPGVIRGADAQPKKADPPTGGHPSTDRSVFDYWLSNAAYHSRPETVESIYIMWKVTGDELWRQRGWEIYQAIENHCKTPAGYASLVNVGFKQTVTTESMPSYFLAETLKYLWLLFTDKDPISLDKWVFNTEAHPLPVFHWTNKEKSVYHIK